jgi:hypothetical protein
MNRLQEKKLTRQEPDSDPNARLLGNGRTGSLLANRAIRARLTEMDIRVRYIREKDIGERDIGERELWERDILERDIRERDIGERDLWERDILVRDIRERDSGETVATGPFAK